MSNDELLLGSILSFKVGSPKSGIAVNANKKCATACVQIFGTCWNRTRRPFRTVAESRTWEVVEILVTESLEVEASLNWNHVQVVTRGQLDCHDPVN